MGQSGEAEGDHLGTTEQWKSARSIEGWAATLLWAHRHWCADSWNYVHCAPHMNSVVVRRRSGLAFLLPGVGHGPRTD